MNTPKKYNRHEMMKQFKEKLLAILDYSGISERRANLLLLAVVIVAALIRLATLSSPLLDRTHWKEIDYIMIAENYHRHGYDFLHPEVSWPAEEPRITPMELPVAPFLTALLFPVLGENTFSMRFTTFMAFLLLIVYMYKLVKREAGMVPALLSAGFAAVFPLFSPFGNLLFSEPLITFLSVFCLYHFAQWTDKAGRYSLAWFVAGFSLVVALNPTSLYLGIPLLWIYFRRYRFQWRQYLHFAWPLALSMVIPIWWYVHAYHLSKAYLEIFGVFGGLTGGHDKFQTLTMLSSFDWYLTMYWRVKSLVLGEPGLLLMASGLVCSFWLRRGQLFSAWLLGVISFFVIVAEGQIDAPYRQLSIIPVAAFLIAMGTIALAVFIREFLLRRIRLIPENVAGILSGVICVLFLAAFPIRKPHLLPKINDQRPQHEGNWLLAQEIRKIAADTTKIIMAGEYSIHKGGYDISPVTYHYAGIQGWSLFPGQWNEAYILQLKQKGATLLGAVDYTREPELKAFLDTLSTRYPVVYSRPEKRLLLLRLDNGIPSGDSE